ncbi:MAG: nucleotidyltransferase domain-containing protein [Candidatus Woesearchaeota archaeon]
MNSIEEAVLKEITPTKNPSVDEFIALLQKKLPKSFEIIPGGSYAKGTHIGSSYDCDVFIRIPGKDKEISKKLYDTLQKQKIDFEKIKGSRDYYSVDYKEAHFELVPVLQIKDAKDAQNIMDMSPFHVDWIKKNSTKKQQQDIRLLKQFMKAQRVYGAESFVKGFSGHVTDLLIIHYGSFDKALKAISSWKKQVVIDIAKHYKGKDISFFMNKAKIESPLVVVDPIIPERNAAAALSEDSFNTLVKAAKQYCKKPNKSFFDIPHVQQSFLKKHKKGMVVSFTPVKGSKDIAGTKALKAFEYITKAIENNGFVLKASDWSFTEGVFLFSVEKESIKPQFEQAGPKTELVEACKAFCTVHSDAYIKKKQYFTKVSRKHTVFKNLLSELLESDYVTERVNINS